jgi:hypothetical protein
MSNLKRYSALPNDSVEFEMVEDSTGPYVKFDDIKEFLPTDEQQLKQAIALVRACAKEYPSTEDYRAFLDYLIYIEQRACV